MLLPLLPMLPSSLRRPPFLRPMPPAAAGQVPAPKPLPQVLVLVLVLLLQLAPVPGLGAALTSSRPGLVPPVLAPQQRAATATPAADASDTRRRAARLLAGRWVIPSLVSALLCLLDHSPAFLWGSCSCSCCCFSSWMESAGAAGGDHHTPPRDRCPSVKADG